MVNQFNMNISKQIKPINLNQQTGFSLIEVLVTVLVLSVGLLGLAALQANALRFNHEGYLRSIATTHAYSMADRMRANPAGLDDGFYDSITANSAGSSCSSGCSTSDVAQSDANDWYTDMSEQLPNGQGTITRNGDTFTITVYYDAERTGATGMNCSTNKQVDLSCVRVDLQI